MTLFAGLLLAGCATSVEYAPPAEEVIVRADGAPYRGAMDRLAVSRDGQFVAFAASGPPLGSGDEWQGVVVYDRHSHTVRGTCEPSGGTLDRFDQWELSEDGRYVMVWQRRCDVETGEVVDVERFPESAYGDGAIAFFKDGSRAAYHDSTIPGVRVTWRGERSN